MSLLLGGNLFFPLPLIGAEQTDPQIQKPEPQPEQAAPKPEQAVPQTEQSAPQIEQPVPKTEISDQFDSMESPRNYISGKITRFASSIDRFFGGDRHYQESNPSVVKIDLTKRDGYAGDGKFDFATRVNLKLPVTEGRLRLLLETDPEKNIMEGPTPAQGNPVNANKVVLPKSTAVALRVVTAEENIWHLSVDGGVRFPLPGKLFVRTRGSLAVPLGQWRLKAAESVYWFNTIGFGETTQLDLERIFSNQFLFRAASNATWLKDNDNFNLRQDLSVYHTLNDRTVLLYQTSAIGISNPQPQVTDYVALLFFRYRLHQKWLFFEFSPQLHFPKEKGYKSSPALSLRLEILFDDSRSI